MNIISTCLYFKIGGLMTTASNESTKLCNSSLNLPYVKTIMLIPVLEYKSCSTDDLSTFSVI